MLQQIHGQSSWHVTRQDTGRIPQQDRLCVQAGLSLSPDGEFVLRTDGVRDLSAVGVFDLCLDKEQQWETRGEIIPGVSWVDSWVASHFSAALCCVFLSSYTDGGADRGSHRTWRAASLHRPRLCCLRLVQDLSVDLHHGDFYFPHIHFTLPTVTCYI